MLTQQILIESKSDLPSAIQSINLASADLVFAFGAVPYFSDPTLHAALRARFPAAKLLGCSTAGEIRGARVFDNTCVITAIDFEGSEVREATTTIEGMADSFAAGERLARALPLEELQGVFVVGTGVKINGSALVAGMQKVLGVTVSLSGGLAADAGAFRETWTLSNSGAASDQLVAVGLYGQRVRIGSGSFGGWEPFGPARKVTRSDGNVLYELDGERALDIYKRYLGEHARSLPGSGLLFPFEMLTKDRDRSGIIRTILGVDEQDGSLTLAGDIDPNGYLKLMQASTDRLVEGAGRAAERSAAASSKLVSPTVALLVSCIGRKLVMGDRVDEEVEAVAGRFSDQSTVAGFYSNGEICAAEAHGDCRLHNQTMTVTWIGESAAAA